MEKPIPTSTNEFYFIFLIQVFASEKMNAFSARKAPLPIQQTFFLKNNLPFLFFCIQVIETKYSPYKHKCKSVNGNGMHCASKSI